MSPSFASKTLRHPHARVVNEVMLEFLDDLFEINTRAILKVHREGPFDGNPAHMHDVQLRLLNPGYLNPVFCVYGAYEARKAGDFFFPEKSVYKPVAKVASVMGEFFATRKEQRYPLADFPLLSLLATLVERLHQVDQYCLASFSSDFTFRGRSHDPRSDDMCRIVLVLKDELDSRGHFDFNAALVIAGPSKIESVLEMARKE